MANASTSAGNALGKLGHLTELRQRLLFVLGALIVFRAGSFIPVPGVNPEAMLQLMESQRGTIIDVFNMFSGGALERFSILALGVMPYISASIVVQILGTALPSLQALKKEGEAGRRTLLLDAAPVVLPPFGEKLSAAAAKELQRIGVEIKLNAMVTNLDATGLDLKHKDGSTERVDAICKVWAAGVQASPLGKTLAEQSGVEVDRAGRVPVQPDLTLPGNPNVFVIGDMMSLDRLPGVAQVAIQGAKYAAKTIIADINGQPRPEKFKYFDKGSMAVISRFGAVAKINEKLQFSGFFAWVAWLGLHLIYVVGFKNRITTLLHWTITFLGSGRSERVTTEQQLVGRLAVKQLGPAFEPTISGILDPKKIDHKKS